MDEIKFYRKGEFRNWLISLAIGRKYLAKFEKFILPLALKYAELNNLGLACVIDDIDKEFTEKIRGKKKTWQKLLIPYVLSNISKSAKNVCYFDSDILFNPYGKNIFDFHNDDCFSIVSQINGLPGSEYLAKKVISYSRNKYYSKKYPLDSAIFMGTKEYYEFHGFKAFEDVCCAGIYVANIKNHMEGLKEIFCKYDNSVDSITGGGDEPAFNFEVRSRFKTKNIPYEFQAIWNYEMAWRYRHLYKKNLTIDDSVINAICSCLMSITALHFAGSWFESKLCYDEKIIKKMLSKDTEEYFKYQNRVSKSTPVGRIIP